MNVKSSDSETQRKVTRRYQVFSFFFLLFLFLNPFFIYQHVLVCKREEEDAAYTH